MTSSPNSSTDFEQPRIGQMQPVAHRLDVGVELVAAFAADRVGLAAGQAGVIAAAFADQDAAAGGQPADPECREEGMQQCRVVGVFDVLDV